jgi:hypothetical protein
MQDAILKRHRPDLSLAHANPELVGEAVYDALNYMIHSWGYSHSKIAKLLRLPVSTVNTWLRSKRVPFGKPPYTPVEDAVLQLIAIHKSLSAMFSDPRDQTAWLETPHPELGTAPAAKIEQSTEGLVYVRQYLDYIRGRGA